MASSDLHEFGRNWYQSWRLFAIALLTNDSAQHRWILQPINPTFHPTYQADTTDETDTTGRMKRQFSVLGSIPTGPTNSRGQRKAPFPSKFAVKRD